MVYAQSLKYEQQLMCLLAYKRNDETFGQERMTIETNMFVLLTRMAK